MTKSQRTSVFGGLLLCGLGLGLPQASYAITGCTNAYLTGTYNAQVSSTNFMSVLNSLNGNTSTTGGTSGSTGSGGSTGSTGGGFFGPGTPTTATGAGGSTGAVGTTTGSNPGFSNNPFSLNGSLPGTSRFFFDGNGNVVGQNPAATNGVQANVNAGTYSVSSDCTATIKLVTGQSFNAVVVNGGAEVLFLQSDANSGGVVGTLQRSTNVCLSNQAFPASFGFSFFGAQPSAAATTGSTGGTASAAANFSAFSAIGSIQLNNDNTFQLKEWLFSNGKVQTLNNVGSYSVSADCSLSLSFASGSGGTTGAVGAGLTTPVTFRGALVNSVSGQLVLQPDAQTTLTGQFIAQ